MKDFLKKCFPNRSSLLYVVTCCLIFVGDGVGNAASTDAIVTIYTKSGPNRSGQGTGFLLGKSGVVATAYHVIQGASDVEVVDSSNQRHANPTIYAMDAGHDLALLKLKGVSGKPGLVLSGTVPAVDEEIQVIGTPLGLPNQIVRGYPTSRTGLIDSRKINDENSDPVFAKSIQVLPIDITVMSGMSGAPILNSSGHAVGVLSGSYGQNRGIGWAIPAEYLMQLIKGEEDGRLISKIQDWPAFTLMRSSWTSLMRSYNRRFSSEHIEKLQFLDTIFPKIEGTWVMNTTKLDGEVAGFFEGDCTKDLVMQNTLEIREVDVENAQLKGVIHRDAKIDAKFVDRGGQFSDEVANRRRCYKAATGSPLPTTTVSAIGTFVGQVNRPEDITAYNVINNCRKDDAPCPGSAFGKERGYVFSVLLPDTIKWGNDIYRRAD